MKKAAMLLSCAIGASTLLGGYTVLAKQANIEFLITDPAIPMYNSIYDCYDSIYMTIMDMSLDYTMKEYNKELLYGIVTFIEREVDNIKSIMFNKHYNKLEIVDEYLTKMVVRLNDEHTNIDKISISGKTPEYLKQYIDNIGKYGSCELQVISFKDYGDIIKVDLKDGYNNEIMYILYEDEFYFQIESDREYTQSKVIYNLMSKQK